MTDVPATMTALHLMGNGGPEMLVLRHDVPVPVPADDEVLVRVRACGMNNTDVNTRVGWYSKSVTAATGSDGFGAAAGDDGTWGGAGLTVAGSIASIGFIALLCVPGSPAFMAVPSWIALAGWVTLGVVFYLTRIADLNRMTRSKLDYLILGKGTSETAIDS